MSTAWLAVLLGSLGCYALKAAGWSLPPSLLERERVRRASTLLPLALLAALVVVQALADGPRLVLDARTAGLAVAGGLVLLRAPFLVVVLGAALTAALLRL